MVRATEQIWAREARFWLHLRVLPLGALWQAETRFEPVHVSGMDFTPEDAPTPSRYPSETAAGALAVFDYDPGVCQGAAVADFDGDGSLDAVLSDLGELPIPLVQRVGTGRELDCLGSWRFGL